MHKVCRQPSQEDSEDNAQVVRKMNLNGAAATLLWCYSCPLMLWGALRIFGWSLHSAYICTLSNQIGISSVTYFQDKLSSRVQSVTFKRKIFISFDWTGFSNICLNDNEIISFLKFSKNMGLACAIKMAIDYVNIRSKHCFINS